MTKMCAWCRGAMGEFEPMADTRVSHGICAQCETREGLLADGEVFLTVTKKDGSSLSGTYHWFQALLRLNFVAALPDFRDFNISGARP